MSNNLYSSIRNDFLTGAFDWASATGLTVAFIDTTKYTANISSDQYYSTISSIPGAVIATAAMSSPTASAGVADAADVTFSSVTGATIGAVVIYNNTGTPSTSQLIAWLDTMAGLPITPNGSDILVQWSNGSNKIFQL